MPGSVNPFRPESHQQETEPTIAAFMVTEQSLIDGIGDCLESGEYLLRQQMSEELAVYREKHVALAGISAEIRRRQTLELIQSLR